MERLTTLISASNIYIALPGSVGTLGELVLVWNHINIDFRVSGGSTKHLICWRSPFEKFLNDTCNSLHLLPIDYQQVHFVDSADEAVQLLKALQH